MRKCFALLLCVCMLLCLTACGGTAEKEKKETRPFTDSCGRTVAVPAEIKTVVPSGSLAQMILYTVCPEKLASLAVALTRVQKQYLDESIRSLPVTGQFYGGAASVSFEEIIGIAPDIIIDMGEAKESVAEDMDALQAQTGGIPVVFIEASLETMEQAYRTLGELVGAEERAAACADYIRDTLAEVTAIAATIPESEKLRTVYAVGEDGTEVYGLGSLHAETLDLVGARNIAVVERYNSKGITEVSLEQMLIWNPDVLILGPDANYREIWSDPAWAEISAVQSGKVYEIPVGPYNWMDQPPSVQRVLALKWLGRLLYPSLFDYDMVSEAQSFYRLFWHYELTETEARTLMANSIFSETEVFADAGN